MPTVRAALTPGELLEGKYEIRRELGRGAMGIVYEALHVALGRRVAVKTLLEGANTDVELGARFEREARAASAIGHPHIVDVFDLGRTPDGMLFMVMELLNGRPLAELLRATPMLPVSLAVDLMSQVLSGLGAAHKNGIVHRDLKPENIFVVASEDRPHFVKLVDFGISKVLGPKSPAATGTAKFAGTMVGAVLGTPLYMSPEQAIGQVAAIDHRTDIYSAGVVLYEMLCGRTPFTGRSYPEVLGQILEGKYRRPSELRPDLPQTVEAAIARALSRDIEARFPSAAAMRAAIVTEPAEITLAPVPAARPLGTAQLAPLQPLADGGPPVPEASPAPQRSSTHRAAPAADPFAPPPEAEAPPLLADTLDGSPRRRPAPAARGKPETALPLIPSPATRSPPRATGTAAPPPEPAATAESTAGPGAAPVVAAPATRPAKRPWLLLAVGAVVLAVALRLAYAAFGPDGKRPLLPRRTSQQNVALVVDPKTASVQIDHVPVAAGLLPVDTAQGRVHILNAAAPGRITRRFSFTAKPGLKLSVRLGRALDLPGTADPPPLAAELDVGYADSPRPTEEIDAAFAKLDRYAECLIVDGGDEGKKGRARLREESLAPCRLAVAQAADSEPAFPELQTAADSFLTTAQRGQRMDVVARAATALRAELLATRAAWQHEELSRQDKDEGQTPAWHMRRVALAAQSWQRARAGGATAAQALEGKRAQLDQAFTTFMAQVRATPALLAQTTGATDFVAATEELLALASGAGGRKATDLAALEATRKVIASFNALVVE